MLGQHAWSSAEVRFGSVRLGSVIGSEDHQKIGTKKKSDFVCSGIAKKVATSLAR